MGKIPAWASLRRKESSKKTLSIWQISDDKSKTAPKVADHLLQLEAQRILFSLSGELVCLLDIAGNASIYDTKTGSHINLRGSSPNPSEAYSFKSYLPSLFLLRHRAHLVDEFTPIVGIVRSKADYLFGWNNTRATNSDFPY